MSSDNVPSLPALPLPRLSPRKPESHKGDFGRCLLIGGSRGMSGAIALAGLAALRSGAGLVKLAVPDVCLDVVAGFEPSYMTVPVASDDEGRLTATAAGTLAELAEVATCVACGPGLGQSPDLIELATWAYRSLTRPLILDADALNALAAGKTELAPAAAPRILTPHPGEFRRLVGERDAQVPWTELAARAVDFARCTSSIVVFKGHRTLITDGDRVTYNSTGNPGLATGGSGDVLTGVIAALVCQGLAPFEAAQLGVFVHGLAGDLAAESLGQMSLIASDLIRFLPHAFCRTCS